MITAEASASGTTVGIQRPNVGTAHRDHTPDPRAGQSCRNDMTGAHQAKPNGHNTERAFPRQETGGLTAATDRDRHLRMTAIADRASNQDWKRTTRAQHLTITTRHCTNQPRYTMTG